METNSKYAENNRASIKTIVNTYTVPDVVGTYGISSSMVNICQGMLYLGANSLITRLLDKEKFVDIYYILFNSGIW